jgi:hypothetical protein
MAIHDRAAPVEDASLRVDARRILAIPGADVPDIVRLDSEPLELQGSGASALDVCDRPVAHPEEVHLQRVDRLEGLLPPALLHRRGILGLLFEMIAVEIEHRVRELELGHHATVQ